MGATKLRVLVAVSPESVHVVSTALRAEFDVAFCSSLTDARLLLAQNFDIIVCGTHFDDCRMFDLLRYCSAMPSLRSTPFLCLRGMSGKLDDTAYQGVEIASRALGAAGFVDLFRLKEEFGSDQASRKLRNTIRHLAMSFKGR